MQRKILAAALFALFATEANAQKTTNQITTPVPVKIAVGLTYQQILPAVTNNTRHSLTIENNKATANGNCYLIINGNGSPWLVGDTTSTTRTQNGATIAAADASYLLLPGGAYTRYFPYIPADQFLATCDNAGSLAIDTQ